MGGGDGGGRSRGFRDGFEGNRVKKMVGMGLRGLRGAGFGYEVGYEMREVGVRRWLRGVG